MLPFHLWEDYPHLDSTYMNPVEETLTDYFAYDTEETPFPHFVEVPGVTETLADTGNPFSGRGYEIVGTPSQEMLDLEQRILSGEITPETVLGYDQMLQPMIQEVEKSEMQQFADQFYGPLIMSAGGLMAGGVGGWLGAALAGGWGALTTGAMTGWEDPLAIALSAAGGFGGGLVGGAAGSALGNAAGFSDDAVKFAAGVGSGFGSSAGRYGGNAIATGEFDPIEFAVQAATGAAAGGASALTNASVNAGLPPSEQNPYAGALAGMAVGNSANALKNYFGGGGNAVKRRY
jgi:hypothetical protein